MQVDEEPAAQQGVNICDYYSRQWCSRTVALAAVVFAILYISWMISFECYTRINEMNELVYKDQLLPVGILAPCSNIRFNVNVKTTTPSYVFDLITTTAVKQLFLDGGHNWTVNGFTFNVTTPSDCPHFIVWSVPNIFAK